MTRDEVIRTMQNIANNHDYRGAEYWTDVFCALGILKLDEGKRSDERSLDFGRAILGAISDAGFRIAPK